MTPPVRCLLYTTRPNLQVKGNGPPHGFNRVDIANNNAPAHIVEVSNGARAVEGQQLRPSNLHGLNPENARLTVWRPGQPQGPISRTIGIGENYGAVPMNVAEIRNTMPTTGYNTQVNWVSPLDKRRFWVLILYSYSHSHRDRVRKLLPLLLPTLQQTGTFPLSDVLILPTALRMI